MITHYVALNNPAKSWTLSWSGANFDTVSQALGGSIGFSTYQGEAVWFDNLVITDLDLSPLDENTIPAGGTTLLLGLGYGLLIQRRKNFSASGSRCQRL